MELGLGTGNAPKLRLTKSITTSLLSCVRALGLRPHTYRMRYLTESKLNL